MTNCSKCKMQNTATTRRLAGCAYEAPHPRAVPWSPMGLRGAPLAICAGYTTALPEVAEASWARAYFEKGSLAQWSDTPITERTRDAIQILAIACDDEQAHQSEERRKAGR